MRWILLLMPLLLLPPPAGADPALTRLMELSKHVGKTFDGRVTRVLEHGAFVDVGGADGLVHVSDLGFSGEKDARKLVKVGQAVRVTVLSVDLDKKRMALSMRRPQDDPWNQAPARYPAGTRVKASVINISSTGFGIFVELEPTVEALVHMSDLPAGKKPADYKVGQPVEVLILRVDPAKRRISASLLR
jgi:small subunit ribosomal protein S1